MDIEFKCDTVMANLSNMKASEAGRYAFGAVRALGELAHNGLRKRDETDATLVSTPEHVASKTGG
jgi:hypothetical protein